MTTETVPEDIGCGLNVLIVHSDAAVLEQTAQSVLNWGGCTVECLAEEEKVVFLATGYDFNLILAEYRENSILPDIIARLWPWIHPVYITLPGASAPQRRPDMNFITAGDEAALKELRTRRIQDRRSMRSDLTFLDGTSQSSAVRFQRFCEGTVRAETFNEGLKELSTGISEMVPSAAVALLSVEEDDTRLLIHFLKEVPPSFIAKVRDGMLGFYRQITGDDLDTQSIRMHTNGMPCNGDGEMAPAVPFFVPAMLGSTLVGLFGLFTEEDAPFTKGSISLLYQVRHQLSLVLTSLAHMSRIAARDVLTGLFNRRGLNEEFERAWQIARDNDRALGVVTMDLDHFKSVNDTYGHAVGDQVLQEMSDLVRWAIRSGDIAGRTGGDEMVLILPMAEASNIMAFSDRLMDQVRKHIFCKNAHGLRLTISLGAVSCFPGRDDLTPAEILIQSDYALYHAKRTGRDRLCLWADVPANLRQRPMESGAAEVPEADNVLVKRLKGRILAVDDDPVIARLLQRILESRDYDVVIADSAESAMEAVRKGINRFDLILVDLGLPGEQGLDFLQRLKRMDETVVGIVITGMASSENILASLRGGAFDFIAKPFRPDMVIQTIDRALDYRRLLVENRNYDIHLEEMVREKSRDLSDALTQLQASYIFTLEAFAALVGAREQDTGQHSQRVSRIARIIGEKMDLPEQDIEDISRGALLHDIGKIAIPDSILLKPGPLTEDERCIIQTHPWVGYNVLKTSTVLSSVAELVYSHQEKYDGSGYPRGLRGEEICIGARIFTVIDSYDAMRANRVYRRSMSVEKAVAELKRGSGTHFDPMVVEIFISLLPEIEQVGQWPEGK